MTSHVPPKHFIRDDGRPMLGRKLKGKSQRELASLRVAIEETHAQ